MWRRVVNMHPATTQRQHQRLEVRPLFLLPAVPQVPRVWSMVMAAALRVNGIVNAYQHNASNAQMNGEINCSRGRRAPDHDRIGRGREARRYAVAQVQHPRMNDRAGDRRQPAGKACGGSLAVLLEPSRVAKEKQVSERHARPTRINRDNAGTFQRRQILAGNGRAASDNETGFAVPFPGDPPEIRQSYPAARLAAWCTCKADTNTFRHPPTCCAACLAQSTNRIAARAC